MAAAASLPYPSDLRDARYLVAVGRLERARWYRSLWAFQLVGVTVSVTIRPASHNGKQW